VVVLAISWRVTGESAGVSKKNRPDEWSTIGLRKEAEQKLRERNTESPSRLVEQDTMRLLHELQVHQVELELQNEALIEARAAAEEGLKRYTDLYDFAPLGYLTVGRNGSIIQVNLAGARLLGLDRGTLVGRKFEHSVAIPHRAAFRAFLESVFSSPSQKSCELTIPRQDQYLCTSDAAAGPVDAIAVRIEATSADEQTCRMVVSDVTARKQAESALRLAHDDLNRQVRARTAELSRTVEDLQQEVRDRIVTEESLRERSAQLRALAAELTMTEQRERHRLAQVLHDHLQQLLAAARFALAPLDAAEPEPMRAAARRADELIERSIKVSRSLTGELSPPVLHDGGLVPSIEWLLRWMEDKHGLKTVLQANDRTATPPEHITVFMFQAIRELLFNVVKHARAQQANVQIEQRIGQVRVTVSDDGAGFDVAHMRPNETTGGFGLFSICERLEVLGGTVEIDSAPGRGSRFVLHVPIETTEVETPLEFGAALPRPAPAVPRIGPPAMQAALHDPGGTIRVLLADDHGVMRQSLARLLDLEADIEVVAEVSDGESAVELAHRLRPSVVLMDLRMPGLNGVEATRLLHRELPDVTVIGLSMYTEAEAGAAMRDAGAVAYVSKCSPVNEVLSAIRSARRPVRQGAAGAAERHGLSERYPIRPAH
jgi:PAS domain S-box-containing protein